MQKNIAITAFYHFFPMDEATVASTRDAIDAKGKELDIRGLVLVATEGLNGTVGGKPEAIEVFKALLSEMQPEMVFKDSYAEVNPCKRWFVKIRDEIVGLGDTSIVPEDMDRNHLTPEEWNQMIEEEDVVLLDTRNDYEVEIGTFEGAVDPKLEIFSEFPKYVEECDIPKDKKVMMFCTGGIRCEKAALEMERQGYKHVYQLKGGILQYLKECPNQKYKGECFVFDKRSAVDQDLKPSTRYAVCPHCGDPGDQRISCNRCGDDGIICARCAAREDRTTCSKNCAEMFRRKGAKTIV